MTNTAETLKEELFTNVRNAIATLEDSSLDGMERTHIIFDVMEQIMARIIAGAAISDETIDEISEQSIDNIKSRARKFLKQEFEQNK